MEPNSDNSYDISLSQPSQTLLFEFTNNWHTTSLNVTFHDDQALVRDQVAAALPAIGNDIKIVYVGAYESANFDQTAKIFIAKHSQPLLLVVSSFTAINWQIDNPDETEIVGVVYGSRHYAGSSQMEGTDAPLYRLDGMPAAYDEEGRQAVVDFVKELTGQAPHAYTPSLYDVGTVKVLP